MIQNTSGIYFVTIGLIVVALILYLSTFIGASSVAVYYTITGMMSAYAFYCVYAYVMPKVPRKPILMIIISTVAVAVLVVAVTFYLAIDQTLLGKALPVYEILGGIIGAWAVYLITDVMGIVKSNKKKVSRATRKKRPGKSVNHNEWVFLIIGIIGGVIGGYAIGYLLPYHLPPSVSMTIPSALYDSVSNVYTVRMNFTNNGWLDCNNIRITLLSGVPINFTGNTSDPHFVCYNNGVTRLSRIWDTNNLTFSLGLQPGAHNCVLLHINGSAYLHIAQPRNIMLLTNASNQSYLLNCQD